jgi:hypothetical protein
MAGICSCWLYVMLQQTSIENHQNDLKRNVYNKVGCADSSSVCRSTCMYGAMLLHMRLLSVLGNPMDEQSYFAPFVES